MRVYSVFITGHYFLSRSNKTVTLTYQYNIHVYWILWPDREGKSTERAWQLLKRKWQCCWE